MNSPAEVCDGLDAIDRAELDDLAAIVGQDGVAEIVSLFVQDAPRQLAAIEAAVQSADSTAIRASAHAYKGAAGGVAARRVASLAKELEQRAREGSTDGADVLLEALVAETRNASSALQDLIA